MADDLFSRISDKATKQLRDNPPPVLLNKAEAFEFAAKGLEKNAAYLALVNDLLKIGTGNATTDPLIAKIKQYAIEPDIQIAAMKAAAATIRDLALEERVIAARTDRQNESGR